MKREVIISFLFVILLSSFVVAGDVVYITKNDKADSYFLGEFSNLGLSVDIINSQDIYSTDFSQYKMIFIGDERFKNAEDFPIDSFPSVIANYYHGYEFGLTNENGVAKLVSNSPLEILTSYPIQVYTQAKYKLGFAGIPYFYLPVKNKNSFMQTIAKTNIGYTQELGDVISYSSQGPDKCFFGIIEPKYWTDESRQLFGECVGFVLGNSPNKIHEVEILEDYTNSVNGIRIKDVETGNYLLDSVAQLECNKKYIIDYKTLNNGDFVEDVNFSGVIGDGVNVFEWYSTKDNLEPGQSTTTGSKTINFSFNPGFYAINIFAYIDDDVDNSNNLRNRNVEVVCPVTGQFVCGNDILESGEECDDGNLVNGDGCSDYCILETMLIHDIGIDDSYTSSVNGIRIKDVETGIYLLDSVAQLECNKKYKIDYKTINKGNFSEDVSFTGMVGDYNWTASKDGLAVDGYTLAGSKTINFSFSPGFYAINIDAEIVVDGNLADNHVSREVEVFCTVDVEGDLVSGIE